MDAEWLYSRVPSASTTVRPKPSSVGRPGALARRPLDGSSSRSGPQSSTYAMVEATYVTSVIFRGRSEVWGYMGMMGL